MTTHDPKCRYVWVSLYWYYEWMKCKEFLLQLNVTIYKKLKC